MVFCGLLRRGCYEGCSEVFNGVVVERAILLKRRVEQKVVKAANVSRLALYKERKERP